MTICFLGIFAFSLLCNLFLLYRIRQQKERPEEREEHERIRVMLDMAPLCCNFWDKNYRKIDCNQALVKLFDLSSKQEYLDRIIELSPECQPDGQNSVEKAIQKLKETFETGYQRFEWVHQKLDGTPIPTEVTLVRVPWGDSHIIVSYIRDLREQLKMLAEKREMDERVQLMLDATPLSCGLWDENFIGIDCNQETVNLFGLKDKQEYCDRFYDLSPEYQPDGQRSIEKAQQLFPQVLETGYLIVPWLHQKLDGTPIPAEVTAVRVQRGDRYIVAAYVRDLREIKKNEMILELNRQRVTKLLELAQMTHHSEEELVDFVIQSITSLTSSPLGYVVLFEHAKDVQPFRALLLDRKIDCVLPLTTKYGTPHTLSASLVECLSTRQVVIQEDFAALPGNRVFPEGHCQINSHMNYPIFDGDKPIGIIGVGNKATPYNDLDTKQLILLGQGLASQLNRKRYAESLERAKQEAERASKAKSEFLARMSHEIRTPLNGVIGLSELLIGTKLNSQQREYVQLVQDSGKSLLFLINDILDFSKIEAGKLEIDSEPFDLPATVESVLAILVSRANSKNLDLTVSFSRNIPRIVQGDSGRIRQILLNLVGNAIKFTDQGGVRIDVIIESVSDTVLMVKFNVTDTGIGIPKNQIGRLFKAFSQANTSSARVYGGTGLGLAISMELVQLMKGHIGVESEEGKGSTFWFKIPFRCDPRVLRCIQSPTNECPLPEEDCPNREENHCAAFMNREIGNEYNLKGRSVLLIDNNKVQSESLCTQLCNWEMDCVTCRSGKEAARLLEESQKCQKPFDLLIIDNAVSDGTGIALANQFFERWKKQKTGKLTPMILLRPFSEKSIDQEFLDKIGAESISKPIFISSLFDAVVNRIFAEEIQEKIDSGVLDSDAFSQEKTARMKARTSKLTELSESEGRLHSEWSGKIHVLVVEDNRVNQIVAKNLLEEAGLTCDVVINGIEACSAVRNKHYDVVLMDCQMPEMDGFEATDLIRSWEREQQKKRLPIIALTANATKEDVQKCFDAGMDAYCSKPINPQAMIHLIEEWYKKSRE